MTDTVEEEEEYHKTVLEISNPIFSGVRSCFNHNGTIINSKKLIVKLFVLVNEYAGRLKEMESNVSALDTRVTGIEKKFKEVESDIQDLWHAVWMMGLLLAATLGFFMAAQLMQTWGVLYR